MAISDFYSAHPNYKTRLGLRFKDVQDVIDVDLAVLELVEQEQVHGVIVSQGSAGETFVAELGRKSQVLIFSFGPRDLLLPGLDNPYFIKTYADDAVQAQALAAICREFMWKEAVIVFEDTDYGYQFLSRLIKAFRDAKIVLAHLAALPVSVDDSRLSKELEFLKQNLTVKVFLVHVGPTLGVRLFTRAEKLGMMSEGHAWVITDRLSNFLGYVGPSTHALMEGVVGLRAPIPFSRDLESFRERWEGNDSDLNIHGLWAYDTVTALAISLEKIGQENSRIPSLGPLFLKELSGNRFPGLSGDFEFLEGRLKTRTVEIFNVVGSGEKSLGSWTPGGGILKELRKVMWPGDSTKQPKGWSVLPSGVLRVGIPCDSGAPEFVNISAASSDPLNDSNISGFAVDVFLAALRELPTPIDHGFCCFGDAENANWSYDDLLDQIEKCDMVVADVTIWAPRTSHVDFSLPYLESGIVLVVKKKTIGMWSFTRPLRWDLWLAIFVSWGMVSNNRSKFVLVCWVFMAFILMQSFTANLSAILTIDQLKFAFSEDYFLGYRRSSFTEKFLVKNLNIDKSKLRGYTTDEEFHDAMSRGSKKGGVDAIFDETPYIKRFMNKYKSQYKIVGPTYRTDGLGFVSFLLSSTSGAFFHFTFRVTTICCPANVSRDSDADGDIFEDALDYEANDVQ
ncbi:Glutamate receptor 2.7 [Striga hermonthica]|uniref:Glutamate receptor 2.7 n=1 Tax=Striga hermonthica TaxID=68872 RepID=A0A9N7R3Y0_STRHE|nr:Glutamate receptor 2.7 [Striga hermonthica]